jgi:hypothetical protein
MGALKDYFLINENNVLLNKWVCRKNIFLVNRNNVLLKWAHWLNYFLF